MIPKIWSGLKAIRPTIDYTKNANQPIIILITSSTYKNA